MPARRTASPAASALLPLLAILLPRRHVGTALAFSPAAVPGWRRPATEARAASPSSSEEGGGSPIELWADLAASQGAAALGAVTVGPSTILGPDVSCGRGLFAASDVSRHEELFRVRAEAILTVEDAFDDAEDGDAFRSLAARGPGWDTVAFAGWLGKHVLLDMLPGDGGGGDDDDGEEDTAATLRTMYLRSLPWSSDEQPHVMWWTKEDAERLLRGSCVFDEAMGIRADVAESAALLTGLLEPTVKGALAEASTGGGGQLAELGLGTDDLDQVYRTLLSGSVRAALVVLMSRSFDESVLGVRGGEGGYDWDDDDDDDDDVPGGRVYGERLVPFFDTMQHTSEEPNVYHAFDEDEDAIVVYAARDLRGGEELVISYHDEMEPQTFAARFGFVPGEARSVRTMLEERSPLFFSNL